MIKYVQKQIEEIRNNRALSWFGLFLTFSHFVTWYNWVPQTAKMSRVLGSASALCWSYFPKCETIRPVSAGLVSVFEWSYFLLAALTVVLWATRRLTGFWFSLLFLTIGKWLILSTDYIFMGNYHYMQIVLILVYLFVSSKERFLTLALISFYVGAGLLKFSPEWYSGATLLRPALIQGKLMEWSLVYVIYLELILVWGLLSSNKWIRWGTWLQLVGFHLYSWHIVGYYYPVTMFSLIACLPLFWLLGEKPQRFTKLQWSRSGVAFLALFWLAQLTPIFFYKKSALTGEGRILSLNMLDAWTECRNSMVVRTQDQNMLLLLPMRKSYGVRIQCDPVVFLSRLRQECKTWQQNPDFVDIDFSLQSKLKTDAEYVEVFNARNVCSHPPKLSFLGEVRQ